MIVSLDAELFMWAELYLGDGLVIADPLVAQPGGETAWLILRSYRTEFFGLVGLH